MLAEEEKSAGPTGSGLVSAHRGAKKLPAYWLEAGRRYFVIAIGVPRATLMDPSIALVMPSAYSSFAR